MKKNCVALQQQDRLSINKMAMSGQRKNDHIFFQNYVINYVIAK